MSNQKKASSAAPAGSGAPVVHKVSNLFHFMKKLQLQIYFFTGTLLSNVLRNSLSLVFQVIMVGSGGVGKSALTLLFMYDEVYISIPIPSS